MKYIVPKRVKKVMAAAQKPERKEESIWVWWRENQYLKAIQKAICKKKLKRLFRWLSLENAFIEIGTKEPSKKMERKWCRVYNF